MTMRYFRVGDGRTLNLPTGLLEGAGPVRVSAPDVEHNLFNEAGTEREPVRGVHPSSFALDTQRIRRVPGGERFIAGCLRNGDLVELDAPAAAKVAAPVSKEPQS